MLALVFAARGDTSSAFFNGQAASLVIGQPDLTTEWEQIQDPTTTQGVRDVVVSGGKLFVADTGNGRVLIWNSVPTMNGQLADIIVGATAFSPTGSPDPQVNLASPVGVVVSDGKLLVSAASAHRILIWNSIPTTNGEKADVVVGQPDFTTTTFGTSATKFWNQQGLAVADGKLFVADMVNSRVLIWNSVPTTNGEPADIVVGQDSFNTNPLLPCSTSATKLCNPNGVAVADGKLYVADTGNHRILAWNSIPTTNGAPADIVLGQPDFVTNNHGTTQANLQGPERVLVAGGRLYVADTTNFRVLIWNSVPTTSGALPDVVLGAPDFDTKVGGFPTATSMGSVAGMAVVGDKFFVADISFDRVLQYSEPPPVGGIVEFIADPDAPPAESTDSNDHTMPIAASVAIGTLLLGAGGLYVVRMRRGSR